MKKKYVKFIITGAAILAPSALLAQSAPAYQSAIEAGLATANTAGGSILAAGAVIVVTMIVWKVIKRFAKSAG